VILLLIASACSGGHTLPPTPTENAAYLHDLKGKILFVSTDKDQSTIVEMKADGSNTTALVHEPTHINSLALSTSGALLFDVYDGRLWSIYRLDAQGQQKLTTGAASDLYPMWSPDEQSIMFTSYRDKHDELYLMNRNGTNIQRLTNGAGSEKCAWSPDGQAVVFVSERDGSEQIYRMNRDGSNAQRLTALESQNIYPAWSPDGQFIAFSSARDGSYQIYIMKADGSDQRRLTTGDADDVEPAWSPDGRYIVFSSNRDVTSQLYIIAIDGTGLVHVPYNGSTTAPLWVN